MGFVRILILFLREVGVMEGLSRLIWFYIYFNTIVLVVELGRELG